MRGCDSLEDTHTSMSLSLLFLFKKHKAEQKTPLPRPSMGLEILQERQTICFHKQSKATKMIKTQPFPWSKTPMLPSFNFGRDAFICF